MTKGLTYRGGSVHYRVFAHDSSLGIIKDNKLDWLVDPSVAEPKLDTLICPSDCTMPEATREFDNVRRFLGVKADDERRGVNGINDVRVVRIGTKVFIVLRKGLSKKKSRAAVRDAHLGPDISIRRSQRTDGWVLVGGAI